MKRTFLSIAATALALVFIFSVTTAIDSAASAKPNFKDYDCCTYFVSFACIPQGYQPRTLPGIWLDGRCRIGILPPVNPNGCVVSGWPNCL